MNEDSSGGKPHAGNQQRSTSRVFADFVAKNEALFNVVSTAITAIFTVVLATSTIFLWKETRDLRDFAQVQSADMKDSIKEAGRAASAMQNVAIAVDANAKASNESLLLFKAANIRQMRAYLTLGLGSVILQNSDTNYRFEVRMLLQNVGNTPAYRVRSNTFVRLLPSPLPLDFKIPDFNETLSGASVMGPHQNNIITGIADRIYSDDEVHEIEFGNSKHLYVYGQVKYKDAFETERETTFCQAILWLKNNTFMSLNTQDFNDAD
jgi:hypothetical protein